MVAGCCACGGSDEPQYATGYSALPASCAEVGTAAGETLHRFAGALPTAGAQLVTKSETDTGLAQGLTCTATYEDPIPRLDEVTTPQPLSRTATIQLLLWTTPTMLAPTTTSTTAPASTDQAATPVPGIGDQADISTRAAGNKISVTMRTKLGNLAINVETQGSNWSGASGTPPTGDSPALRIDLAAGAESIAKALAQNLPASLPRKTLQPETPTTPAPPSTTTTLAPQPVWDPCTIPDADLNAAGLNPQSKKSDTPSPTQKQCRWTSPSHEVAVFTRDSRFTDWAYEVFTQPRPLTIGPRRALTVTSDMPNDPRCTLLFDIPQSTKDGIPTGVVQVEASTNTPGDRDTLCSELTRLAVPLTQHFPPSR
ncbi:DUF3558 family protein [Nocardia blacklockiae]|uniref:DUF3558 family protein n=1 Tax=Nocardia blacklockiae TaxID=480036 RepID=UPI0018945392|nr:DUF3558 family protein [Nocardia blacklockiae]MBF6176197.1 DUF3558 family protein [Nocardia blacklockiae]